MYLLQEIRNVLFVLPIIKDMAPALDLKDRFIRNLPAISAQQVDILRAKTVCIVGCGGIGGYVAETLVRLGIGALTLIDSEVFEVSNLNRQLYALETNLGKPKATEAAARLRLVNSSVQVRIEKTRLDTSNALTLIDGCDAAVDALDSVESRLILQDACEKALIPLIHGAIDGWTAQISTVFPGDKTLTALYQNTTENDKTGASHSTGNLPFTAMAAAALECAQLVRILLEGKNGAKLRNSVLTMDLFDAEFRLFSMEGKHNG